MTDDDPYMYDPPRPNNWPPDDSGDPVTLTSGVDEQDRLMLVVEHPDGVEHVLVEGREHNAVQPVCVDPAACDDLLGGHYWNGSQSPMGFSTISTRRCRLCGLMQRKSEEWENVE